MSRDTGHNAVSDELSFLFHKDVQRIFNNFTALFKIRIGFCSPDGRELKVGLDRGLCSYCRMVRLCPGGKEACREEDRNARLKSLEKQSLLVYTCHGGMTEAVKPILREGNLLGFAMIGQIRMAEKPPARWGALWAQRNQFPPLAEAFREQPLCSKADLPRILEFFSDIMDMLSSQGKIRAAGSDRLSTLTGWMKNRPDDRISLNEAAERIGLSPSRLSHLIKERYGISFSRLLINIRMEKARFFLTHYPEKSIKEIALLLGYGDPLYFTKQFKKETGISPDQYKKQQDIP